MLSFNLNSNIYICIRMYMYICIHVIYFSSLNTFTSKQYIYSPNASLASSYNYIIYTTSKFLYNICERQTDL